MKEGIEKTADGDLEEVRDSGTVLEGTLHFVKLNFFSKIFGYGLKFHSV